MKSKKFVASTTRAALARVREVLGDDAVILSNRSTPQGVEVRAIAERDFEALVSVESVDAGSHGVDVADSTVQRPASRQPNAVVELSRAAPTGHPTPATGSESVYTPGYWSAEPEAAKPFRFVDYVRSKLAAKSHATGARGGAVEGSGGTDSAHAVSGWQSSNDGASPQGGDGAVSQGRSAGSVLVREVREQPASPAPQPEAVRTPRSSTAPRDARGMVEPRRAPTPIPTHADSRPILEELRALREFVAERFDRLSAGEEASTNLVGAMLRRELLDVGFQPMIVRAALESLPTEFAASQARDWVEARLARSLGCAADDLVDTGGVFALTGATGVGKTTTAAKLAARCAVRYGADSVGLVTTDTYRIGAPDQLRIYGKILGVPVHTVHDPQLMQRTLEALAGRRLVIIDTMGMGQRDGRVRAHLEMLDLCQVKRLLLLGAPSQPETLEEVIEFYQGRSSAGAILTKIDETVKLAPALGVLLRYRLKLRYLTNGQRVPEDLQAADAATLVRAALAAGPRTGSSNGSEVLSQRNRDVASSR